MFKEYLILIALILLSGSIELTGQNSKWSWGISFTPQYSLSTIDDDLVESENQFGLTIQPIIGYQLNNRIEIISGMLYVLNQVNMIDYSLVFGCDINMDGINYRNSWMENDVRVHYLGLPLQAKYNFSKEGSTVYLRLGYNQLIKIKESGSSTIHQCNDLIETMSNREVRDLASEIEFGVGVEIDSKAHSKLLLEVVGGYSLTGVYTDHPTFKNIRILDIGLRIGVMLN